MKGKCPDCKKELALKQSGRLRIHNNWQGSFCLGSNKTVKPIPRPKVKCRCGKQAMYEVYIDGAKRGNQLCPDDALELVTELLKGKEKGGNGQLIIVPMD